METDHLEDPGVEWRIILRWMWGNGLVDPAQERDRWQHL